MRNSIWIIDKDDKLLFSEGNMNFELQQGPDKSLVEIAHGKDGLVFGIDADFHLNVRKRDNNGVFIWSKEGADKYKYVTVNIHNFVWLGLSDYRISYYKYDRSRPLSIKAEIDIPVETVPQIPDSSTPDNGGSTSQSEPPTGGSTSQSEPNTGDDQGSSLPDNCAQVADGDYNLIFTGSNVGTTGTLKIYKHFKSTGCALENQSLTIPTNRR